MKNKLTKALCWILGHKNYELNGDWDWSKCVRCKTWICNRYWHLEDYEFTEKHD
jgi:hypothetical protein